MPDDWWGNLDNSEYNVESEAYMVTNLFRPTWEEVPLNSVRLTFIYLCYYCAYTPPFFLLRILLKMVSIGRLPRPDQGS